MKLFSNLRELLAVASGKSSNGLCMVVSEQEGAEIWVAGKRTQYVTPKLVAVPKNRDVLIEVKQCGHESHKAWVRTTHDLSFHYCDLKRIPLKLVNDQENQKTHVAPSHP